VQLSGTGALADALCDQIKAKTDIKRVRGDTFGYLQRSFLGCVSDVDAREARDVGDKAVRFAETAGRNGSVTIHRVGDYAVDYRFNDLTDIAAKTQVMTDAMINADGNGVTDVFARYITPLLGSDMPRAYRLGDNPVARILNP